MKKFLPLSFRNGHILFMFVLIVNFGFSQPAVDWCNLQHPATGTIEVGNSFLVYAQVYEPSVTDAVGQGAGISAWIGYSTENTDPSTWTNWIPATYNVDDGNNDEYMAEIGSLLPVGTYYYASRFMLSGGSYQYGGYNGGFWDGINNVSGVLVVNSPAIPSVDWCNLQYPPSDTIDFGNTYTVYAQVYEPGVTDAAGQGAGISAWIGYSTENTDPSTWTNWIPATYNIDAGNNDEYMAEIASSFSLSPGTYYYASRFMLSGGSYQYGGYNGGFWDGTNNVSGVLVVNNNTAISNYSFSDISIYPNPAQSIFYVSVGNFSKKIKINILNMLGQVVYSSIFENNNSDISLDVRLLPAGTYIVRIELNDKLINKPLIIKEK